MQDVTLLSERLRLHSKATERCHEQIFEEMKEMEVKKSKEALLLVQKKHILIRYQSDRDKARMLRRPGGSRVIRSGADMRDTLSFESCTSSVVGVFRVLEEDAGEGGDRA